MITGFLANAKDLFPDQLIVVVGISKEAELAQGKNISVVISGADPRRLREDLRLLNLDNVRAIVSYGVAGGLNPHYRPGDVIIPHHVVIGEKKWATDALLSSQFAGQMVGQGIVVHDGTLVGSNEVIMTPQAKKDLQIRTGADAVDMESHIAAEFAAAHSIPFAVVRAISDPAERALPSVTKNSIKPNGDIRIWRIIGKLLLHPWQLPDLIRAGQDSSAAFGILEKCRLLLEPTIQAAE